MKTKGLSLYHKFSLMFIIGGILPMTVVVTIVFSHLVQAYKTSLIENHTQSLAYAGAMIEGQLEKYEELSKLTYIYNANNQSSSEFFSENPFSIRDILLETTNIGINNDNSFNAVRRRTSMQTFLRYAVYTDPYVLGAYFIDFRGELYNYAVNSLIKPDVNIKDLIPDNYLDPENRQMMVMTTRLNDYFTGRNREVLSMGRHYFDVSGPPGQAKYMGTFFFDVDIDMIATVFEHMGNNQQGSVYLMDGNNDCLYTNADQWTGDSWTPHLETLMSDEEDYTILTYTFDNGWHLYYHLSYFALFSRLLELQNFLYVIIAVSVLALMLSSIIFTRRLTRPIRSLIHHMSKFESGDFLSEIPVTSRDEIGALTIRFNQMGKELHDYIQKVFVADVKQKEAELTALKSQIYPHFLYNTLEVIRMTAIEQDDLIVSDMIEALSDQIRYVVGKVGDFVPLGKEVAIIEKYVLLINYRIKGNIRIKIDIKGYRDLQVPKLILQPIVENAYIHGIKPQNKDGHIRIYVEETQQAIEIVVMDNGVGISEAGLAHIQMLLDGTEMGIRNQDNWQSIGLKNVHDRLVFLFGQGFGLKINSTLGTGTMVSIILPKPRN